MNRSLLLLSRMRISGQLRTIRRTLSTPRGMLLAMIWFGFFAMVGLPYFLTRNLPRAASREQMPQMTWFLHPAALLGFLCISFVGSRFKSPLAFSMPEVEFLFPGPFTRRELLVYKLGVSTIGTFGFAIMSPLIIPFVWGPAALVGMWQALTFMQWSGILLTMGTSWLGSRYRLILVVVLTALLAVVVGSIWQSGALNENLEVHERLLALDKSWGIRLVLAPFEVLSLAIRAESFQSLALWSGLALAMNLAVAATILRLDRFFIEASLFASQRHYDSMQRFKRSGGVPSLLSRAKPRMGIPSFPRLGGVGTIAWRQSLEMLRGSGRLLFILPAVVGPFAAIFVASSRRGGLPTSGIVIALTLFTGLLITTLMPLGLRTDLDHVEVIKTLPIAPRRIVWGSIGASILYITLVQLVVVVAMLVALRQWEPAALAGLALSLPVNILVVGCDSGLVLMFPSIRRFSPGDVLAGIRAILVNFAKVFLAMAATGLAAIVFFATRYLVAEPLVAFGAAWTFLMIEGLITVWITALLFQHYDPSQHVLDGE